MTVQFYGFRNGSGSFATLAANARTRFRRLDQLVELRLRRHAIALMRYARHQSLTTFAKAPAIRIASTGTIAMAIASAAGDDVSRSVNVETGVIGRISLSAERIKSTSISSSLKGIILTGSLKFHDLRHLVLASRALVGALVVPRSVRKDADQ